MEEQLQSTLTSIWEISEEGEELLIQKLYKLSFAEHLKSEQIIFLCSRLINSNLNLLQYINDNCGKTNRKFVSFQAKIIDFLKEFIITYSSYCLDFLDKIRRTSISIYQGEDSQVLREKILSFTAKVIQTYPSDLIESIYKPKDYIVTLLNEIKYNRLTSAIKGSVWYIIGILVGKFPFELLDFKIEVNDVLFNDFKSLVGKTKKFEFKAVTGMLKSFNYILYDCHLKGNQISELYTFLKSLTHPLEDANSIKINKLALEVLGTHGKVFNQQLQKDSIDLFENVFELCNHKNYELKMAANEAIEKISLHISDCLLEENTLHKDVFRLILDNIKNVLEKKNASMLTNTAISLVGIFSNAIVRFLDEGILLKYLEELIVICDKDIVKSLGKEAYHQAKTMSYMDSEYSRYKPSKSIKYILSIQKQYISLLNSYSNIIANLSNLSELIMEHFYRIVIIGFSTHSKFYSKYKEKLTDSIAGIIVNMVRHHNFFWLFLRKVVKNGFIESIRLSQNMLFKEIAAEESIANSVNFWTMLLTRDKSFTEYTVNKFFDQLMSEIMGLLDSLNISYSEKVNENNNVYYEAIKEEDLEIYTRTGKFVSVFIGKVKNNSPIEKLILRWVVIIMRKYIYFANEFPRIAITYTVIGVVMKFCEEAKVFEDKKLKENIDSFLEEFKHFNLSLVKKIEIFQDELLLEAVELLLSIPIALLIQIYSGNNIEMLKSLYKKSFEIGFNDIRYSNLALASLEKFFNYNLSNRTINDTILNDILPLFGNYLLEYEKIKRGLNKGGNLSLYTTHEESMDNYTKVQNTIFDLLGKIGGNAHNIIGNSKELQSNKIVNIANTAKIIYSFPLYNKKYNIHFDHLLAKIADMALNSMTKEKKTFSCELLHSIVVYIIGKQNEDMTNSLIFLTEKILLLSCDLDKAISLIFEKLLFQIIHWMSKKGSISNNKDIISMLDIIIDSSSSRKNLKLRELSSECLSEYIKWFIKQHSNLTVKEKSSSIKYLIRKIESNALHPDPFKRLGSAQCFDKVLGVIIKNEFLVDKFLLEIVFFILTISKINHANEELNEFIFKSCVHSIELIKSGIEKHYALLNKINQKRNFFRCISELFSFLHEVLISNELESCYIAQNLYADIYNIQNTKGNLNKTLREYWTEENLWPKLEDIEDSERKVNSISIYQFVHFIINKNLVELNELGYKYSNYSMEKLALQLSEIAPHIINDENKKICFIYIVNILKSKEKISSPLIVKIITQQNKQSNTTNLIWTIFDIISTFKETEHKIFALNHYSNITSFFYSSMKDLIEMILISKSKIIPIIIEKYLVEQCFLFSKISDVFQSDSFSTSSLSYNSLSSDFFFWLISHNDLIYNFSQTFTSRINDNFIFLIEHHQPKFISLLKKYFDFIFISNFDKACDVLTQSQQYLDIVADSFLRNFINETKTSKIKNFELKASNFIIKNCKDNNITIIFILLEKVTLEKKKKLIELISKIFVSNLSHLDKYDIIVNQIKIMTMILISIEDKLISPPVDDIEKIAMKIIDMYINQKAINIIKEILNLLGLIVKISNSSNREEIRNKYITIQSRYFPINTKCLIKNTKEWNDFQLIFDCLLCTFRRVRTFTFLEILFPILREEKSEYSKQVQISLKEYIKDIILLREQSEIQKSIDVFLDRAIDNNLRDNIRFTLMKLITFKLIKKSTDKKMICDLFIANFNKMKNIINESNNNINNNSGTVTSDAKFISIIEKSIIYKFFNLIFEKIDLDAYKNYIHKQLYGDNSQGNEITKFLIIELHNSKRRKIPDWEKICKNIHFTEYNQQDSTIYLNKVENGYYCSAYCCLCALINLTQTKIDVYLKFLFKTLEQSERMFDLLISSNYVYNFPIETNFEVKKIGNSKANDEVKMEVDEENKQPKEKKLLIDTVITDSFFHDAYGATIKDSLCFEQKNFSLDFIDIIKKGLISNEGINANGVNEVSTIEEDQINKHPIMKSFLCVIEHMHTMFPQDSLNKDKLPPHLQEIYNEMNRVDLKVNQKIFFIKVILNEIKIFQPYMKFFIPLLFKFSSDKANKCGSGFHYFLRDIATYIIACKDLSIDKTKENINLTSQYINALIKLCGDTKNIIFRTNLKIVNDLMSKFRNVIYLNKSTIFEMLKIDDKKEASHIWKITAVQILASAMEFDIPIGDDLLYVNSNERKSNFILSLENNKEIILSLKNLCSNSRMPVQSATIELIAKIMHYYFELNEVNDKIYDYFNTHVTMMSVSLNEKIKVNTIFRMCLHFSLFLSKKEIFNISLQLIQKSLQKQRNLILNAMINFESEIIKRIINKNSTNEIEDFSYISDIHDTLYQSVDIIFVDPNDEFIVNIIGVIEQFLLLNNKKFSSGIHKIICKIQLEILRKNYSTREIYYNFLVKCFNAVCSFDEDLTQYLLNVIIINFDMEKESDLIKIFIDFFNQNNNNKIPSNPVDRLIYVLKCLNNETIKYEGKLIQLLAKVIFALIYTSADYELEIYEKGLEECVYRDLNINTTGYYLNRSQPLAPSIMMRSTMDDAYQTLLTASMDANSQLMVKSTFVNSNTSNAIDINNKSYPMDIIKEEEQKPQRQYNNMLSMRQRDITLSQYSSLIITTENYHSMVNQSDKLNNTMTITLDDGFKVPFPVNRVNTPKKKRRYGNFYTENDISYTPIDQSNSNRIRFIPEGAYRNPKKQGDKNQSQQTTNLIYKYLNRQNTIHRNQVKFLRNYKDGDLPYIQIKNKDILDPLIQICNNNDDISCELFLEIMTSIYEESKNQGKNTQLEQCIESILSQNKLLNYLVVNCLHRMILGFMKENVSYIPNLDVIKTSGLYSKNYHTAILIFEEFISNNGRSFTESSKKIKSVSIQNNTGKTDIIINSKTQQAWAYLLKFYSKLKINDTQIGLVQNFSINSSFYIKEDNDFLSALSFQITKSSNCLNVNIDKANLLKATFGIYQKDKIDIQIDQLRMKFNIDIFKDESLKEVIEDYALASCSDLGEWDDINQYLNSNGSFSFKSELTSEIIKSSIYGNNQMNSDIINCLSKDERELYSYYLSLYYAKNKDFDNAYLFYQKAKSNFYKDWLNLGKYSNNDLKHEIVENIQKIYEMGEFLNFIKGTKATNKNLSNTTSENNFTLSEVGVKSIISLTENWLRRWPNHLYDEPRTFQEIYSERKIINNILKSRIMNYEQIVSLNPVLDTFDCRENIEIAKCLYKKNALDLAGVHIKSALNCRKDNAYVNGFIVYPVLKNKCRLYEIESMANTLSDGIQVTNFQIQSKYEKFIKILNNQMNIPHLTNETKDRLLILQVKILLNIAILNLKEEKIFCSLFQNAQREFDKIEIRLKENSEKLYLKLLRPMIKFCDTIIRNMEYEMLNTSKLYHSYESICKIYLEYGLKSLIANDIKMISIIPKIFDILYKNDKNLSGIFSKYAIKVNMKYYLKWKNQLISYINTNISHLLFPIIENILKKEPQSLFFTFSTIEKYSNIFSKGKKDTELFNYMKRTYSSFTNLNAILEALDCLTHPEHKLRFWLKQISLVIAKCAIMDYDTQMNKIKHIINAIEYDILNTNKQYINNKIGSYNRKFAKDYHNLILNTLSESKISKILSTNKSPEEKGKLFNALIEPINTAINKSLNSQNNQNSDNTQSIGIEKLSTFSEWLSQYENNEYVNNKNSILLPSSSINLNKVIISSFDQHIMICSSIRLPKRITIYGNDEKSYLYLIKGCEDLRLDQRIEEIFKVMNGILARDSNCAKKKITLKTFEVIPMTQKLGMIEWINNTMPLSGVIKFSMQKLFGEDNWDIKSSSAQQARLKWYNSFIPQSSSIQEQHYKVFRSYSVKEITNAFRSHENLLPKSILKKALMHYHLTPEEILTTRIDFMRNYSALSIACYILGIGDRHLENFLVNIQTSEIVAIDFGVAFGQGLAQIIPELVPFRLTCQIRNILSPFAIRGTIRQTMIDCFASFRLTKENILDYCEVFIKEPLLEWGEGEERIGTPIRKVEIVNKKLNGYNPMKLMIGEILVSPSCRMQQVRKAVQDLMEKILYGVDIDGERSKNRDKEMLEVETQVDVLNETAIDPNLLGRMWIGWSPFI